MSALAQITSKSEGTIVTGSDVSQKFFTDSILEKAGITVLDFNPENVVNADLVVVSAAYDDTHPEVIKARELNIPVFSYPQFLGRLMSEKKAFVLPALMGRLLPLLWLAKYA